MTPAVVDAMIAAVGLGLLVVGIGFAASWPIATAVLGALILGVVLLSKIKRRPQ